MITKTLLIYNNNDQALHDYFTQCAERTKYLFNMSSLKDISFEVIVDQDCCKNKLLNYLDAYKKENLFMIVFSHGAEDGFYFNSERFFYDDPCFNLSSLSNGLIYSNSCLSGKVFGRSLGEKEVPFFGYCAEMKISMLSKEIFVDCDTYGVLYLLQGATLGALKDKMKEKIKMARDQLLARNDLFGAAYLHDYINNMVIYGNSSKSFFVNRKLES